MSAHTGNTGPLSVVGEHRIRATEQEASLNLHTVLQLCAAGRTAVQREDPPPLRGDGRCRGRSARARRLLPARPDRVVRVAADHPGRWARQDRGRAPPPDPKGRTALRPPPAEVIRQLWQRWLTHAVIDEFSRIEQIKGQRARNVLTSAKTRRQTVAQGWPAAHPESGSAWIPCSRPCDGKG